MDVSVLQFCRKKKSKMLQNILLHNIKYSESQERKAVQFRQLFPHNNQTEEAMQQTGGLRWAVRRPPDQHIGHLRLHTAGMCPALPHCPPGSNIGGNLGGSTSGTTRNNRRCTLHNRVHPYVFNFNTKIFFISTLYLRNISFRDLLNRKY